MSKEVTHPILAPESIGQDMRTLMEALYPICRSITGEGVRETLRLIQQHIPLEIHELETGTQVFDWTVPREWNIKDAYIIDPTGKKIVDFADSNLHVLNYSIPVNGTYSLDELKPHLISIPDQPELIPYRTSYYQENWAFCIPHALLESLEEGEYTVCIDSSLEAGSLSYGELFIPGESEEEILISSHVCHPSLANDNLSGIAVNTFTAKKLLQGAKRRFSYRFIFAPGTIGAISWLARNKDKTTNIKHGLITSLLGTEGNFVYKRSRRGNAKVDQVVEYLLEQSGHGFEIDDFIPYGYDERQYCSPGFNLAVGNFSKARWGQYPEYHTSADNLDLVKDEAMITSFGLFNQILDTLEQNRTFENLNPYCEPQLGKRGLFDQISGSNMNRKTYTLALLWVLNLSDGEHDLLAIAKRSGIDFETIASVAQKLEEHHLLRLV